MGKAMGLDGQDGTNLSEIGAKLIKKDNCGQNTEGTGICKTTCLTRSHREANILDVIDTATASPRLRR